MVSDVQYLCNLLKMIYELRKKKKPSTWKGLGFVYLRLI